jgi:hypothetical protein
MQSSQTALLAQEVGCTVYVLNNNQCLPSADFTLDLSGATTYLDCCGCACQNGRGDKFHDYCSSVSMIFPSCQPSPSLRVLLYPGKYCFEQEFEVILVDPPIHFLGVSSRSTPGGGTVSSSSSSSSVSSSSFSSGSLPAYTPFFKAQRCDNQSTFYIENSAWYANYFSVDMSIGAFVQVYNYSTTPTGYHCAELIATASSADYGYFVHWPSGDFSSCSDCADILPSVAGCEQCNTFYTTWGDLKNVTSDINNTPATVTFTYSFMKPGTDTDNGLTLELKDQSGDDSVSNTEFKQEIRDALQEWKEAFEAACPWLTLVFDDLNNGADESGTLPPGSVQGGAYSIGPSGTYPDVGDLRFGMHNIDGAGSIIGHAYNPAGTLGLTGSLGGDVHFDSANDFRLDSTTPAMDSGAISILLVAVHEIGHALGFGHHDRWEAIMYASVSSSETFAANHPNGLAGSYFDVQCVQCIYDVADVLPLTANLKGTN